MLRKRVPQQGAVFGRSMSRCGARNLKTICSFASLRYLEPLRVCQINMNKNQMNWVLSGLHLLLWQQSEASHWCYRRMEQSTTFSNIINFKNKQKNVLLDRINPNLQIDDILCFWSLPFDLCSLN